MNVRDIVISEFRNLFLRHGIRVSSEILAIAETPFNLRAVQEAVDKDLERIRRESSFLTSIEITRKVQEREKYHEERLQKLARTYALKIFEIQRTGFLSVYRVAIEQRSLKESAGVSCDIYPCEKT